MNQQSQLEVLVNQVGYDLYGSKEFVVQASQNSGQKKGKFYIRNLFTGKRVYSGELEYFGGVYENTSDDWGFRYWRGEFSSLQEPGKYSVEVDFGRVKGCSYSFRVDQSLLFKRTISVSLSYLKAIRNRNLNNGILEDDGKFYDCNGGWYEMGTFGSTFMRDASLTMWALINLYERRTCEETVAGLSQSILDEIVWGAKWWKKIMIHYPQSGQIIAGMGGWHKDNGVLTWYDPPYGLHQHRVLLSVYLYAKLYQILGDSSFIDRAKLMWDHYKDWILTDKIFSLYHDRHGKNQQDYGVSYYASWAEPEKNYTKVDDAAFLFGDIELYKITGEEKYRKHGEAIAKRLLDEAQGIEGCFKYWNNCWDHLHATSLAYFTLNFPTHPFSSTIRKELEKFADALLEDARENSPFSIARKQMIYYLGWNPNGIPLNTDKGYFNRGDEGKGNNPQYGLEAWQLLLISKAVPKKEYVDFARAHLNWILGINPRNYCMMQGMGSYSPSMERWCRFDGAICHGLVSDHEKDKPWMGTWFDNALDPHKDTIAGHKVWAQAETMIRGTAGYLMALSLLEDL